MIELVKTIMALLAVVFYAALVLSLTFAPIFVAWHFIVKFW